MRKSKTVVLGIGLIVLAIILGKSLADTKKPVRPSNKTAIPTVFAERVQNSTIPIVVIESGSLIAKNRIELFSEVQGVMEQTSREFKTGARYKSGETLVHIRSNDYEANLHAQKSTLQNLITSILPDLRLDFPVAYKSWDNYIRNFDINKPVRNLPKTSSEKEKFFITGKNIYTTYYNTKNMEIILSKYNLRAPFNGILTDALVTPGTLVRQGQKLGEYIDPSLYELEVSVSKNLLSVLEIGKQVEITDPDNGSLRWLGVIKRINGKVDNSTQTVMVFIQLSGEQLKEGMYLEAQMNAKSIPNAYEIPRNLLVDESSVYLIADSVLSLGQIKPIYYNEKTVVIRGLNNGDLLVSKPVPGGYSGMVIQLYQNL